MPGEGTPTVEPSVAEALGDRPQEDELALDVAEARIAEKLFGVAKEVTIGRYKLLEEVGRGGMGVVWGAWDPELERKVVVKVLDPLRTAARDRIVDEARALAKLSHPNVVPIYDVGVVDERAYLVMEWVAGDNLRTHFAEPRTVREIVELYTQAARGLAAVHAAGLVHRDFKPENAILGKDGRVRVLDFGLARGEVSDANDIAGTPRYMAPEQRAGAKATPAIDQFALCVALRETLLQRGDLPRWLAAIADRGTAEKPEQRFASMDELIRALGRDPARVWTRRALVGAALGVSVAGFAIGRSATTDPCSSPSSNGLPLAIRTAISAHLDVLGGFAASERPALVELLDEHERKGSTARHGACVAYDRGELTTALYERRLTCLARAQASIAATTEILLHATATTFADARVAAGALVDPSLCTSADASLVPPPDPEVRLAVRAAESEIERARILTTAARPDAPVVAALAREHAEATKYAPVLARALLVEGRAQMAVDENRARATLERAMREAFAAHDDATGVEAFARLAFLVAYFEAKAIEGASVVDPIAARLGPGAFARLLFLNNLAVVRFSTLDDPDGARPLLETALRDWRLGESEDDYELVSIPQNLAMVAGNPARSLELLEQARAGLTKMFGRDHPKVIEVDRVSIHFLDLPRARTQLASACERLGRLFPWRSNDRSQCEYDAGWLADEAGDHRDAVAHWKAVAFAADDPRFPIVAAMLALGTPEARDPSTLERAADSARESARSPWTRLNAADTFIAAARAWETAGNPAAAKRCWASVKSLLEPIKRPAVARRLARARQALDNR